MSVVIDTGEIAIAQGNSVRHMRQWDDDDKFVGKAENDRNDASWGRKLNQSNDKQGYVFEDSYICFSFLVKRDSFMEFWYPGYVTFKINDEVIWHQKNFGPKPSGIPESEQNVYIYASCNDATGDKRTLVHINVPTRRISHFKTINKVSCSIGHGLAWVNETEEAIWNFTNNNIKVHQYYRWYKSGNVYNLANSGSDDGNGNNGYFQTPMSIKRKDTTSTTVTLNSKQLENTTNSEFFTESGGKINLIFSLEQYLHDSRYRIPEKCIFSGELKAGGTGTKTIENINSGGELTTDATKIYTINSSEFANFKKITSAQILFSGHDSNNEKKNIIITNASFKNCDLYENVPVEVDISERIINHYDSMTKTQVTLHSLLKGTIETPANYPFSFGQSNTAKLIKRNDSGTYDEKYQKVKISLNNQGKPTIEIREDYIGSVDGSFKYTRSCEPEEAYWLRYTVTNLLKTEVNETARGKNFDFIGNNATISFYNNSSKVYVALNGPSPSIKYIKNNILYKVPGSIILNGESLYFENNAEKAFKIYDLDTCALQSNAKGYMVINNKTTNFEVSPGANYLRENLISNLTNTNETIDVTIGYTFKNGNETLNTKHPFEDHFIFGRLTKIPDLEVLKTRDKTIRYYLRDNTGDRDYKIGDKVLSSNQLIDRRAKKQGFFSLSREPVANRLTQEKLTVQIKVETNDEEGKLTYVNYGNPINLKINDDNLEKVLSLLKENQTNSFEFNETFFDINDIKDIDFSLIEGQIGFDLTLEYIYVKDNGEGFITEPLLEILVRDISFSTTIEPIGLRKRGVIINPEKNQDLDSIDNFQINVNNNAYTTKTEDGKEIMIWQKQNGLKIVFKTTDKDLIGNPITLPTFEIYLGEDGFVHLSNCKIDEPPAAAET